MQDPRIRIAAAAILSLAAFMSLQGAAAVFLWWLVFTPRLQLAKKIRLVFSLILMIAFFSLVLELSGGNGLSYFARMTVIILIGMWIFSEQKSGEFLAIGVWLFGNRTGFDLGMVAEMGIQSLYQSLPILTVFVWQKRSKVCNGEYTASSLQVWYLFMVH